MKNSRIRYLLLGVVLSTSSLLYSENDFEKEFLAFEQSINSEFVDFDKDIHEEFNKMLKDNWEEFYSTQAPVPYTKPKPKVLPSIKEEKKITVNIISPIVKINYIKKKEFIVLPVKKKINNVVDGFKKININFYSKSIEFIVDEKANYTSSNVSAKYISDFYSNIIQTKYNLLLKQIKMQRDILHLNDWATYQLIHKIGMSIYRNENLANLFSWFVLSELGFDSRIAYSKENIYLLSTINHELYQVSFIVKNDKKYYILTPSGRNSPISSMYTYKGEHFNSSKKLSFFMNKEIALNGNIKVRDLSFRYFKTDYLVQARYSKDLIDFYNTYPQSNFNVYFESVNSSLIANSLLEELKPLVEGKSELEAANFLLRFVQKAFKYKTDPKQFGYEKPFFVEETIFYPYSDCEDRSILFSYLIQNLLGLDTVGIQYDGHLATAIAFNSEVSGDNFSKYNKIFTIADPTYTNANIGMTMKQYKDSTFKVISLHE